MSLIKVLAFEDDALHAEILQMHLQNLNYQLLGIHNCAHDAVRLISATRPDVILMDIELAGDISGIHAAQKINSIFNIPLIYLTSLPTGTILNEVKSTFPEAYLTKPYTLDQLRCAIEISVYKYQKELESPHHKDIYHPSDFIYVKVNNNLVKLCYSEITHIEAYDKYCFVHTSCKKHLVSVTLKQLLQKLSPAQFLQVHRSYVINLNGISGIRPNQNAIEIGEALVPYSKSFKDELFARINVV